MGISIISTATAASKQSTDHLLGLVVLALIAVLGVGVLVVRLAGRRGWQLGRVRGWMLVPAAALVIGGLIAGIVLARSGAPSPSSASQTSALAANPNLDPGTPIHGPAPGFSLSDQFGHRVSLASYRGKVVILAFNDSECTTVCPLTTTAMVQAKAMLGPAASRVALLGIDANPAATSIKDVWSYSELHGMLHSWSFLTGPLRQLEQVWKHYGIEAQIVHGQVDHTPALFVIDPRGRLSRLYQTQMAFTAVPQLAQLLARSAAALLPGKPAVHAEISYARVPTIAPDQAASLPRAGGGTVTVGPGRGPRLFVFFATWDRQTTGLARDLVALNRYQRLAERTGLPQLTAVDEASVEPGPGAVARFLSGLPGGLRYPVAIDRTGRLADGYEVLDLPWFVLVSGSGRLLYYRDASTAGWPSATLLARYVLAGLARAPAAGGAAAVVRALAGSPAPLAALHAQAGQIVGDEPALAARLRALRGYPIVLNAWASWCGPCKAEFGMLASAAGRFGRRVAFLGADTGDSAGDARTFLAQHPVSYPSYEATVSNLSWLAALNDLPTTVFINSAGKVVFVHIGQYDSQGTLDQDVESYALGGH